MCKHINTSSNINSNVSPMPSMTLSIPDELHAYIKEHNEIRWSEIARRAMWDFARKLELLDKLTENSTLTEDDVKEIDDKVKAAIFEHHRKYIK
jgi:hypothetical protein